VAVVSAAHLLSIRGRARARFEVDEEGGLRGCVRLKPPSGEGASCDSAREDRLVKVREKRGKLV